MRHLKPDEVEYVTRPRTVYEESIWIQLEGRPRADPNYYILWGMFLWSRQDEVFPKELFQDVLMTDFDEHQQRCIAAMNARRVEREFFTHLDTSWRFDFKERPFDRARAQAWIELHPEFRVSDIEEQTSE